MQAFQARQLIKQHLIKRGKQQNVQITERTVRHWWRLFNVAVFYGKLVQPKIIILPEKRLGGEFYNCYGYLYPCGCDDQGRCNGIGLQRTFSSKRTFLIVLVHEMVHAWQLIHHGKDGHGKRFFAWQTRIKNTVGLPLDVKVGSDQ